MKNFTKSQISRILWIYNPEHDMDSSDSAPVVTWREEVLASAILEMENDINALRQQIEAILEAYPLARNVIQKE